MNAARDPQWQYSITIYSISNNKTTQTQYSFPFGIIVIYLTMNLELHPFSKALSDCN